MELAKTERLVEAYSALLVVRMPLLEPVPAEEAEVPTVGRWKEQLPPEQPQTGLSLGQPV